MRSARFKIRGGRAVYHCVARTVNREFLIDDEAKQVLRQLLWQIADFSGVEIITYCLMSNHFHVLVRVPERGRISLSDGELMRRYRVLYSKPTKYQEAEAMKFEEKLKENGEEAAQIRQRLLIRMHDVSAFMKTLKQRFSGWYNRTHNRVGTLWGERFKGPLVEDADPALRITAAYIDLNPVRAGLAADPKDYRWSGFGEATKGSVVARAGIIAAVEGGGLNWKAAAGKYRRLLYCKGTPSSREGKARIPRKRWRKEMEKGEKLPVSSALRCRVRYFTDGAVLGSEAFVQSVFEEFRGSFGKRRKSGPRTMRGSDWEGLTVLRSLRKEVFK